MTDIKRAARELIETCVKSATLIGNADQVKRGNVILEQYDWTAPTWGPEFHDWGLP